MLFELEVLVTRRIADMALEVRMVRDRLPEEIPVPQLNGPEPARGEHYPGGSAALMDVRPNQAEIRALRRAIMALPRDIREKIWTVARIGCGDAAVLDWDSTIAEAALLTDEELTADLVDEPDLHDHLGKGLYLSGATGTAEG